MTLDYVNIWKRSASFSINSLVLNWVEHGFSLWISLNQELNFYKYTLFFYNNTLYKNSKAQIGYKKKQIKNKVKLRLCSVIYRFGFIFREIEFRETIDLYFGKFFKISFFSFLFFPSFSTGQCEVIVKYKNWNLLEHE